ncbi:MAG: DGQHR domain-containing protein [Chitinophagales bacterium]
MMKINRIIYVKGFLVNQLTFKPIATTSINFTDLLEIIKFTARKVDSYDPFNPYHDISQIADNANKIYYQRLTNEKRVKDIYNFILAEINNVNTKRNNALGSFPTAIILSMDLNEEFENVEGFKTFFEGLESSEYSGAFYKVNGNDIELYVPNRKVSLIVDGQHRLAAMTKLYQDAKSNSIKIGRNKLEHEYPDLTNELIITSLEKFEFNCTLLIGFDRWEQGKVFADVNFNQKPVNKSLYYDIFGSFPNPDKNDIFLAHMLAMHLNNSSKSPINGFIKMLGAGSGYFSQAFFVEAIVDHFRPKGVWGSLPLDYLNGGEKHKILPKFFKAYFRSIKKSFYEFWPKDHETTSRSYKNILCKTTGMGALIKLINPIYRDLQRSDVDLHNITEDDLTAKFDSIFEKISSKGKKYFSPDSDFSGAGSLGLQNKLFKKMGEDLGYFRSS